MSEEKRVDAIETEEAVDEKEMHIEETPTEEVPAQESEESADASAEAEQAVDAAAEEEPVQPKRRKVRWSRVAVLAGMMAICFAAGVVLGYFVSGAKELRRQLDDSERLLAAFEAAEAVREEEEETSNDSTVEPEATGVALIMNDTEVDADTAALSGVGYTDGNSALIGTDGEEIDSRSAEAAVEYDGGTISVSAVIARYNELYAKHIFAGGWSGHDSILNEAMRSLAAEAVGLIHAAELGFTELTADDAAEISSRAAEEYLTFPADSGITVEQLEEVLTAEWWMEKLFAHVTASVTVTDAEVKAAYEALLEEQKTAYAEGGADYEDAWHSGDIVVYNPAGYRVVDYVLIPLSAANAARAAEITDLIASLDPEVDAETIARYEIERAGLYTEIAVAAEDIHTTVEAAEDAVAVIRSVTGAGVVTDDAVVSASSDNLPEDVLAAVMGLSEIGAHSDVIRTDAGYVIACYSADVPAGEVEMTDEVVAAIGQVLLNQARQDAYDAQMAVWLEEANVTYHPERMQ